MSLIGVDMVLIKIVIISGYLEASPPERTSAWDIYILLLQPPKSNLTRKQHLTLIEETEQLKGFIW